MEIVEKSLSEIRPYEKNPRKNDAAVKYVEESIREFGFRIPIIIDKNGVIVCGHTRFKAAKKIGLEKVPCIYADDLTEEQIKAFRIADNRTGEIAEWDWDALEQEIKSLTDFDISKIGFDISTINKDEFFQGKERDKAAEEEDYKKFLEKFEVKKTTDDCYTPELVYRAIAEWVENEYKKPQEIFVRPFYPGGDYENYKYPDGCVVVDNPPFSILSEILNFYINRGIQFFLFAPTLTAFSAIGEKEACAIVCKTAITYENGAKVNTSFVTNLDRKRCRTAPELQEAIERADYENTHKGENKLPKYTYPDELITAAMIGKLAKYGIEFSVERDETEFVRSLDEQKESGEAIYGGGYLISEKAAAEKAAAEKAAAEKAAAEKAAARVWKLSEKEKAIVRNLSRVVHTREEGDLEEENKTSE